MPVKKVWTDEEIRVLADNWRDHDQQQLHDRFLPDKTVIQINNKKMDMGLKGKRKWTDEERALLLEHGASYSHVEIHERFLPSKTPRQITDMRKYFGIKRRLPNDIHTVRPASVR
jgi:hypothetical protein